jgi:hypothetical protein
MGRLAMAAAAVALLASGAHAAERATPTYRVEVLATDLAAGRNAAAKEIARRETGQENVDSLIAGLDVESETIEAGRYRGRLAVLLREAPQPGMQPQQDMKPDAQATDQHREPLPRPRWVLTIALRETGAGYRWDREDPAGKAWRVPTRESGISMVGTSGDADERDILGTGRPGADSLARLARRHGASAAAAVIYSRDGSSATLVGWRKETPEIVVEEKMRIAGDPSSTRPDVAKAVASLILEWEGEEGLPEPGPSGQAAVPDEQAAPAQRHAPATGHPVAPAGSLTMAMRREAPGRIAVTFESGAERLQEIGTLARSLGLEGLVSRLNDRGASVSGFWSGTEDTLAERLAANGFAVRRP